MGGWKIIAAASSTTSLRSILESKKFEKKFLTYAPPPPWTPPGPPIFYNFSVLDHRSPFYKFFFYYITVFLFIFSLFLFTFFSIIEGRAVVIQPPQVYFTYYLSFSLYKEADDSLAHLHFERTHPMYIHNLVFTVLFIFLLSLSYG